jgi:TonB family protein
VQEGQEGTVVARFVVDARGRVTDARAVKPCPWPLLNEETLRTIRNQWRFPEGRVRVYEVVIHFQLEK